MGIARPWLLVAGMLWVMCWSGHQATGQGVGLVLNGVAHANNSVVTITDIGTDGAALLCTTTYSPCCDSANPETQWYFPNRSEVLNSDQSGIPIGDLPFYRTRNTPVPSVRLNRQPEGTTTGIFHCTVPDANGVLQSMFVGVYDNNTGTPTATTLVYNETARTLTCTSTGGPATTVTWRKSGDIIAINATYQQTQVVTNTTTGTYETVLTIANSVTDVFDIYNCTIENVRGTSSVIAVTGVGLVLNGVAHANNSIVTITDIGTDGAALLCTTTYSSCCDSTNPETQWYFPNRCEVLNSDQSGIPIGDLPFYRTRNTPAFVVGSPDPIPSVELNRHPEGTTTGIFRCTVPDANGVTQSLYVGIYTSTAGTPSTTALVYNESTRSLTCTSTGGPATTVTWRKDGAIIAIGAAYQQTQVVTDSTTGTYETVLTIAQSVTDISGTYSCSVENTRGTSGAIEATVSSFQVSITPGANPTAGQSYTFTCTVTPQGELTGSPTVQWRGPGSSDPITTGGDFTVSSTPPYTLTINPLRQSHDGQYTCQATIRNIAGTASTMLTVRVPSTSVVITPIGIPVAGQSYSLNCSINGADSLSPTSTTYRWYNSSGDPMMPVTVTTSNLFTFNPLRPYHTGQYICEVTITSPYLNGDLSQRVIQDITVQSVQPTTEAPITVPTIVGIVVALVVVIIILVVIMGVVIGILIARNKRYQLSTQTSAVKAQPVRWTAVDKPDNEDVVITQCEAYGLANPNLEQEYEEIPVSGERWQLPVAEDDIPTNLCPAYVQTSEQKERIEDLEDYI